MNNPNPFLPQGSLLQQQSKRRSRLKLGVFCVLAVGISGLAAMLIQGCKREQENPPETDNTAPATQQTNDMSQGETNVPTAENQGATPEAPAPASPQAPANAALPVAPVLPATPVLPTENEYVVVRGDYLQKIAKENGTTVKAIEAANPGLSPTRLRIGQKLIIPAGATGANAAGETANGLAANGDEIYVIKSGDTLSKIAHHYGVTVKAIMTENNLTTTKINVGKKLEIPAKQAAEPAPVNSPPATTTAPAPEPNPPTQQTAPPGQGQ
ncbi:MAG: LysM peptidoglycan-binding domain-containing protein [Limisphaerales bacterium]